MIAGGTCTVTATQAGNTYYSAAAPVSQSFTVSPATQTISFGTLANQAYGAAPSPLTATATSGLPVSFASQTTSVCTVATATVTLIAGGTCTIQAIQAGNSVTLRHSGQPKLHGDVGDSKRSRSARSPSQAYGTAPFTVTATATSGLPVSFASQTTSVCTVATATVTLIAGGTCTIQATQAGNATYAAATPVNQSFLVASTTQTITFNALPSQDGTRPFHRHRDRQLESPR